MHADFWHQRWAEDRIGFHLADVNPLLTRHFDRLADNTSLQVFMPMCGKSVDINWLAGRCSKVTGVDISQRAISDFFTEQHMQAEREPSGLLEWWKADNIELACGDFFHLTAEDLAGTRLVYDRAALIALPRDMRADYAAHMTSLLEAGSRMLLITIEYDQSALDGPPFSVSEEEVRSLYGTDFDIELVESCDALNDRFRERGLSEMLEKAYILRRRDTA